MIDTIYVSVIDTMLYHEPAGSWYQQQGFTVAVAFFGGCIAPLIVTLLRTLFFRARIQVDLKHSSKEGFVVPTIDTKGNPRWYVKARVRNKNRLVTAKDCRAYLVNVEIRKKGESDFAPTRYNSTIQLHWADVGPERCFSGLEIQKDIDAWVDLLYSVNDRDTHYFMPDYQLYHITYLKLFEDTGDYRFTVAVSGANFKTHWIKFDYAWNGKSEVISVKKI